MFSTALPFQLNAFSAFLTLIAVVLYFASHAIYNLYFHPLSKFPGPKLAAATKSYEFYHDVIKGGQFFYAIQRMHAEYGPIVRINPNELHISDASYYSTLYAGGSSKRDKYVWFTNAGGSPRSSFATQHHSVHRTRRSALNPFFSKQSVTRLEPLIHQKTDLICERLEAHLTRNRPFEFGAAYMSFALDTISSYSFGDSECWNCLNESEFNSIWKETFVNAFENATLVRYVPWVTVLLFSLPPRWIMKLHKPMGMFSMTFHTIRATVLRFLAAEQEGKLPSKQTIFSELRNGNLPASEKEPERLIDEANILMIAGGEAITQLLSIISYHLLDNPTALARLQEELHTAMPDTNTPVTWNDLEKLPYLSAVIQEGLRISAIVTTRLPRVAPDEVLQYGGYEIPQGTPVSMTSHFIHLDPLLWPEPLKFEPDRWTAETSSGVPKGNREHLVPFSKGSRGCIGINLAHAQAFIVLAKVFRRFDFELYETTRRDVTTVRDCFNGQPYKGSKGVRAIVTGIRA